MHDYGVPYLRADVSAALKELPVDYYSAAHARSERYKHAVGIFLARAERRLAERRRVGVVGDLDRQSRNLGKLLRERIIFQPEISRKQHGSVHRNHTRATHADGAGFDPRRFLKPVAERGNIFADAVPALRTARGSLARGNHLTVLIRQHALNKCAAYVHS